MNKFDSARRDLTSDLEELIFLFNDLYIKLKKFRSELVKTRKDIAKLNFQLLSKNLQSYLKNISRYKSDLLKLKHSNSNTEKLRSEKYKYRELLRLMVNLTSSLITSTDWQSPSFMHSITPNSGRQSGKIVGTINDYKRDVHLDEQEYERMFLKEYIDAKYKFMLKSYLVNSGQAAFQTILTYLLSEKKINGKILVGQSSYFQYKQILRGTFGWNAIPITEMKSPSILEKIRREKPGAIFLDTLANSSDLALPDLKNIVDYIYRTSDREIYLIIDNTCLSITCQPFKMRKSNRRVHLITFESLNKYYQFGLDRVTAGIITCENRDAGGIFEYRKHAGTNISDTSVYALPRPDRKMLNKRLLRAQRNAFELAGFLAETLTDNKKSKIEKIIYPKLKNHPAYKRSNNLEFTGSFLNIQLKKRYDSPKIMKKLMDSVIKEARKKEVNIVGGTSFGLNTSRIYLTSLWTKFGRPFLRVSLGTEDYLELSKIKAVFWEVLGKF